MTPLNFNPSTWKTLVCESSPKPLSKSHPYICFEGLSKKCILSHLNNPPNKLSLREIYQITSKNFSLFNSTEKEELRTGFQKIQKRSEEKFNRHFFLIRVLIKTMQCFRNVFTGLGFDTDAGLFDQLYAVKRPSNQFSNQSNRNPSHDVTEMKKTLPKLLSEEYFNPEKNKTKQEEFKKTLQHKPSESIYEYAKQDCFGIKHEYVSSFKDDYKLQVIYNSLSLDQFKEFIRGSLEVEYSAEDFFKRIILFTHKQTKKNQDRLYPQLVEIMDKAMKPSKLWGCLSSCYDHHIAFVRQFLILKLNDKNYETYFDNIYSSNRSVLNAALEKNLIEHVSVEQWKKINAWASKKYLVDIEKMSKEYMEFREASGNQEKIISLFRKVCRCDRQSERDKVCKTLKPLLKEITVLDIRLFSSEKNNAFNILVKGNGFNFDLIIAVINALGKEKEKLKALLEITTARPNFGRRFLEEIDNHHKFSCDEYFLVKDLLSDLFKKYPPEDKPKSQPPPNYGVPPQSSPSISKLIQETCNIQLICNPLNRYWVDIARQLFPILKKASSQEIAYYSASNAFNIAGEQANFNPHILTAVINVLEEPENLKAFLETTAVRPNFGLAFLKEVQQNKYRYLNSSMVERLSKDLFKQYEEAELLGSFKRLRNSRGVSAVLRRALGKNEESCLFKSIAKEITNIDLIRYVNPKYDSFQLAHLNPDAEYDPLLGLFKHLDFNLLRVFLEQAFKRKDLGLPFYNRIIGLITEIDSSKRSLLLDWISDQIALIETYHDFLPTLSKENDSHVALAIQYLITASECVENSKIKRYEILYIKNPQLFEAALKKGEPLFLPQTYSRITAWLNKKKEEVPFSLEQLKARNQILHSFETYRKDPLKLKVYLNLKEENYSEEFKQNLKIVTHRMTIEEVALFSTKNNNCFGITQTSNYFNSGKLYDLLFNSFEDPDKLKAFISSTVKRTDLGNGVYVALMMQSHQKGSPFSESLFSCLLQALEKQGKLQSFFLDLFKWDDGKGKEGSFGTACIALGSHYIKERLKQDPLFKEKLRPPVAQLCSTLKNNQKLIVKEILRKAFPGDDLTQFNLHLSVRKVSHPTIPSNPKNLQIIKYSSAK